MIHAVEFARANSASRIKIASPNGATSSIGAPDGGGPARRAASRSAAPSRDVCWLRRWSSSAKRSTRPIVSGVPFGVCARNTLGPVVTGRHHSTPDSSVGNIRGSGDAALNASASANARGNVGATRRERRPCRTLAPGARSGRSAIRGEEHDGSIPVPVRLVREVRPLRSLGPTRPHAPSESRSPACQPRTTSPTTDRIRDDIGRLIGSDHPRRAMPLASPAC